SFIMALLSQVLAYFQGEPRAYYSYIALSPSIALVSVIACFRGYFQGLKNMRPTAISQITEQSVKLVFGLLLCSAFGSTPEEKGALACLAVTLSEAGAVVYLAFIYGKNKPPISKNSAKFPTKRLILTVIPITLSSIILPAARLYDGFTIINILKTYLPNALSLYGVYTGSVETVIGVPVAVCYGLAVAVLPSVSHLISQGKINKAYDEVGKSLLITLILSFSASIIVFFSADTITSLLFGKFNVGEREITSRLLSSAAFNIVLLSLIQTETGCLIALGKTYCPCATLFTGLLSKIILQPLLLKIVEINIFAPLICDILCYFVAVFLNLVYIIICNNKRRTEDELNDHRDRNTGGRSLPQGL
ncbi:MAG: oligosaccharide flippase family protein, partial [Clostridia bacterium]|nr:oligosaccharide flippase family protein [Clostridia bacterium]